MNTILTDSELKEAVKLAFELEKIGIDALIIQDMGLLKKLAEQNYSTPLHMSTQCDNYLPQKIKFFNNMGVSRVVLARETSIEQIKRIHQENPDLELEGFIHGALCVSMSGQCYLSQYIGGRSANRGECAQPCRKKYTVETTDGEIIKKDFYALCLKDFNTSNSIEELIDAGVYSLKIEGRLKDVGYVKNIVAYYRQKLGKGISSGKSIYPFTPNPEKSFNRGFTEYFLKERTNCFNFDSPKSKGEYLGKIIEVKKDCFKIKTDKKINVQDGLFFNGDGCSVNKIVDNCIYPNKTLKIKIGDIVFRNLDIEFEKELTKPVKRQIGVNIEVAKNSLIVVDEDNISITKPLPTGEKANNAKKMKETFIKQISKTGDSDFYIKAIDVTTEIPFMPVSEINHFRRSLFDELMNKRIEHYKTSIKETQKPIKFIPYFLTEVDYRANIHNKEAKSFYEKFGTEVIETSFESKKPNRQVALMRCKHCLKYALNMCKSPKNIVLKDEKGVIYPLNFDCKNCEMSVMSPN